MNDTIVYYPCKTQSRFLFFTIPVGCLALVVAGHCLPSLVGPALLFTGMAVFCLWATKELYDDSLRAVCFEQEGLRFVGGHPLEYRYIPWAELSYGYYTRGYRGHPFLVLSANALTPEEARCYANKGTNSGKMLYGRVAVIYLDIAKDVTPIKAFVGNHVTHIQTY